MSSLMQNNNHRQHYQYREQPNVATNGGGGGGGNQDNPSPTSSAALASANHYELDYSPPNSNTSTLKQKYLSNLSAMSRNGGGVGGSPNLSHQNGMRLFTGKNEKIALKFTNDLIFFWETRIFRFDFEFHIQPKVNRLKSYHLILLFHL